MKKVLLFLLLIKLLQVDAQMHTSPSNGVNLIIITTDGFRWQEMFNGIDTAIANNPKFNEEDSLGIYKKYSQSPIMPFVSNYMAKNGQVWGNRNYSNNLAVHNPYWFSYPGYSELFCGYVDDSVNSNGHPNNPNTTLLDFLQKQPTYKNRIAAFGAWYAFDRILNEPRAVYPIFNAFDKYVNTKSSIANTINKLNKEAYKPWDDEECLDVFTHNMALDYLKTQQPKVLYIGYGETDEWAHAGKYKAYLNAARQVDNYIKEIWDYVQSNPFYKNNTILLVTTDHGRGLGEEWTSHKSKIAFSNQTWFAIMGKGVKATGMQKQSATYYQKQLAQTVAHLMGLKFVCEHAVAEKINL
jgi:Metalloenzyme superfamily